MEKLLEYSKYLLSETSLPERERKKIGVLANLMEEMIDSQKAATPAQKHQTSGSISKPQFLTTSQSADYLKVSETTIRRMVERGQLKPHRAKRRGPMRFLPEELLNATILE